MKKRTVPVIAGPTASGKTEIAIRLAEKIGGEIVSADSMQIYKYMNIGSAKPTPKETARARHWLVDEIDPARPFSVAEYSIMARDAIEDIFSRGLVPIVAGGTGLYINSIIYDMDFSSASADNELREYYRTLAGEHGGQNIHDILAKKDPEAAARIHPNNIKKIIRAIEAADSGNNIPDFEKSFRKTSSYDTVIFCLEREREELYDRINRRVDIMIDMGLEEEIRSLLDMGLRSDDISMKGIGYKEIIGAFDGLYDMDEAVRLTKRNSRRYAKRQMTWFRRYGDEMHTIMLSGKDVDSALKEITDILDEML